MSAETDVQTEFADDVVAAAVERLNAGSRDLAATSLIDRIQIADQIRRSVVRRSRDWVDACCTAKGISTSAARSEEILAGPATTARYLALLAQSLRAIAQQGRPQLPGRLRRSKDGRLRVPIFPAQGVFDPIVFMGLHAELRMQPGVEPDNLHGNLLEPLLTPPAEAPSCVVLGAGNVSSIPPTDALSKLFQEGECVLLKLSPVNAYMAEIFHDVFTPAISRGWLQIVTGDIDVANRAINDSEIDAVHITGSHHTHDAIVWGGTPAERRQRKADNAPALDKPISSELGNVSPWIFVPGSYSSSQLACQATNVAASLTNNAGFNCLATRVILTWKKWPQRQAFLEQVQSVLDSIPPRVAYYPGAYERFEKFTGHPPPECEQGTLPWTLLTEVDPNEQPQLFEDESFVCVACEVALDAPTPEAFLEAAVEFCNDRLFGTLCASVTLPGDFRRGQADLVERSIDELRYGSVCVNQFAGLVYGLMTPPWGGAPGSTLNDVQSGIGSVHNLYFLDRFEKTVLYGPLKNFPKPIWFPSHSRAETVGWKLVDFYGSVSVGKLPGMLVPAMLG